MCRQTPAAHDLGLPAGQVGQDELDRLLGGRRGVEDVYPLSPIQTLFYSANPGPSCRCSISGIARWRELNVSAFQRAWQETLQRHAILRSTIHGDGLPEPMQMCIATSSCPGQ